MNTLWELPHRGLILFVSLLLGCAFIALMTGLLGDSHAAVILLDRKTAMLPYPWTIQNIMHLFFFIGLGELFTRWRVAERELAFHSRSFLPEDDETVLQAHDLGDIRVKVKSLYTGEHGFLPYLIDLCILQFQASRSVDQAVSVLNGALDLISHRVDLRYSLSRYLVWLIPTIGFIGTVLGIAFALKDINPEQPDLQQITASLGMAFYTTLVALVQSAILVLLLHLAQTREERSVSDAGSAVLKNMINRLYTGS